MKKVILFNMLTLDGFYEGPGGDIDWHNTDEEFNQFAIQQTGTAGGLLFGRRTYELMAGYWPTPQAVGDDPEVAALMNSLPKVVFSRTLQEAGWNNTRIARGGLRAEIEKLKAEPGNDLFLFGSGELARALISQHLIDEYRLMINPVLLGRGSPMFSGLDRRRDLKLLSARPFRSGNVLLSYAAGPS
jgi:dihydrofolate reductase